MNATPAYLTPSQLRKRINELISDEQSTTSPDTPWSTARRIFFADRMATAALVTFVGIIVLILSGVFFEQAYQRTHADQGLNKTIEISGQQVELVSLQGIPDLGPGLRTQYPFGVDQLGRDVFLRILEGGKVSLTVSLTAAIITTILAMILGTMAGYYKGRVDTVISRYFDIQWAFPTLLLAISLSTALATSDGIWFIKRGSLLLLILIMGLVAIPYLGRMIRSQVLSLSELEYVEAGRAMGASNWRVMYREIMPNLIPVVLTYFGILVTMNILFEAALSFLGVGVLPPTPSWGNILADGKIYYSTAAWISLIPGIFIAVTTLCLNLMTQTLEEALDPKAMGR